MEPLTIDLVNRSARMRRSQYDLNDRLPISREALKLLVLDIIRTTPSGFDSQTARLVLLWDAEHRRLWDVVREVERGRTAPERFPQKAQKMDGFKRGAGTILFFEDGDILRALEQRFPKVAYSVPLFSSHTSAMHQYAAWAQFAALGIGASLQHYNPVADDAIKQAFGLPDAWELHAQLVFGGIETFTTKEKKQHLKPEERLTVLGG